MDEEQFTFLDGRILARRESVGSNFVGRVQANFAKLRCPSCGSPDCCFGCDGSRGADENNRETEKDVANRLSLNASVEAVAAFLDGLVLGGLVTKETADQVDESLRFALSSRDVLRDGPREGDAAACSATRPGDSECVREGLAAAVHGLSETDKHAVFRVINRLLEAFISPDSVDGPTAAPINCYVLGMMVVDLHQFLASRLFFAQVKPTERTANDPE